MNYKQTVKIGISENCREKSTTLRRVADCHRTLTKWRNYFSQLLNVRGDSDIRQTEIQTAEELVPEPSASEVEMATEKLKRHKSSAIN